MREPLGARVEVVVLDPQDRPVPSATLAIRDRTVFDVREDGVQRLDMVTDHRGRRTFARVEPGKTVIRARWGSRKGAQKVELKDGETTRVTVVVK